MASITYRFLWCLLAPEGGLEPTTLRLTAEDLPFTALLKSAIYHSLSWTYQRHTDFLAVGITRCDPPF